MYLRLKISLKCYVVYFEFPSSTQTGFFTARLPRALWITKEENAGCVYHTDWLWSSLGKGLSDYPAQGWGGWCQKSVISSIESFFWLRVVGWRAASGSSLIAAREYHCALSTGQGSLRATGKAVELWRPCIPQTLFQSRGWPVERVVRSSSGLRAQLQPQWRQWENQDH